MGPDVPPPSAARSLCSRPPLASPRRPRPVRPWTSGTPRPWAPRAGGPGDTSNSDGILDGGETFALTERIRNADAVGLTNVHGSLAYTGGGVVIEAIGARSSPRPRPSRTTPTPFDGEGDNLTSSAGRLASEASVRAGLDFTLNVTSDEGPPRSRSRWGPGWRVRC